MRLTVTSLVVLFACSVTTVLEAQQHSHVTGPRFGLLVGMNRATLGGSDAEGGEPRTSVIGGVTLAFPIGSILSLQPEFLFSAKGEQETEAGVTGVVKMNYFEMPVLLRLDVPVAGDVRPFLYAGPAPAYRLSCDVEGTDGATTISMSCRQFDDQFGAGDVTFNLVDVGLVLGGGLSFDLTGRKLTMGIRYNLGFGWISELRCWV
jgi:hypothetical protein